MTKASVRQTLALYWRYARHHKNYVIGLGIMLPLITIAGDVITPLVSAHILEQMATQIGSGHVDPASFIQPLTWYSILLIGTYIIGWRAVNYCGWKLEQMVMREIDEDSLAHLSGQSMAFHNNRFAGSLVSQANKFSSSFVMLVDTILYSLGPFVVSLPLMIIVLAVQAPWVGAIFAVSSLAYIVIAYVTNHKLRHLSRKVSEAQSKQSGILSDVLGNIAAVKAQGFEEREQAHYRQTTGERYDASIAVMRAVLRRSTYSSSINISANVLSVVIAVIAAWQWGLGLAVAILIVQYALRISGQLRNFDQILRSSNRIFADSAEMTEIMALQPTITDPAQPQPLKLSRGHIHFDAVSFHYTDNQKHSQLFANFSLDIAPGQKIGLVGHSGSGKTTLTKLLLRFIDVNKGVIAIDGQDIRSVRQADLRQAIAYVPQEPLLFHRSIAENIAYGRPDASAKDIEAAAKKAHAHEFITQLADGYGTLVGERGVKLSGGQRQRIVIARAILKDAPILILDEATSALDSESEKLIQEALTTLMKGRTSIVVAHRLSTIASLDRIIVLENGQILEDGAHDTLLQSGSTYASLWKHQSGGFIDNQTQDTL